MKIAILTFNRTTNYGASLQCYALSTFLRDAGHETVIINLAMPGSNSPRWSFRRIASAIKRRFVNRFCNPQLTEFDRYPVPQSRFVSLEEELQDVFDQFSLEKTGVISPLFLSESDLKTNYPRADMYIVGSDQVWNPKITGNHALLYFFSFLHEEPRISYAASFGGSVEVVFRKEDCLRLPALLNQFKAVSVREESGRTFLSDRFNIHADVVVDPTFLIPVDNYRKLADESRICGKGYVYIYKFIINDSWVNTINEISRQMNLKVRNDGEFIQIPDFEYHPVLSVQGWLQLIQTSDFIITDSFHCTVFCLLFKKRFLTAPSYAGGEGRMVSLLKDAGLEDRFCRNIAQVREKLPQLVKSIDYDQVYDNLSKKIGDSKRFLLNQLSCNNQ